MCSFFHFAVQRRVERIYMRFNQGPDSVYLSVGDNENPRILELERISDIDLNQLFYLLGKGDPIKSVAYPRSRS